MLAKFSVKKPFTVLVGVILVVIFGVVAYSRLSPDLLPNIDLPYVVIVTTYPGASPERVRDEVTIPLEQSMAGLSGIKTIESSSEANYCMLTLEFAADADMDALTADMNTRISLLKDGWGDGVGSTYVMELNPNLLPVNVSAVAADDMDAAELSDFVKNTLMPRLEGVDGVASVAATGLVERSVSVYISREKLDAVNARLAEAAGASRRGEAEGLARAGEQITRDLSSLESSENELTRSLLTAVNELDARRSELATTAAALAEISETLAYLDKTQATLDYAVPLLNEGAETAARLEGEEAALTGAPDEDKAVSVRAEWEILDSRLAEYGMTRADLPAALAYAAQTQSDADAAYARADEALSAYGLERSGLEAELVSLENENNSLLTAADALNDAAERLENGELNEPEALELLEKNAPGAFSASETLSAARERQAELDERAELLKNELERVEASARELESVVALEAANADISEKITVELISSLLTAQDFSMPAGYVTDGWSDWLVRVGDELESADELAGLPLYDPELEGFEPIRLGDVAEIEFLDTSASVYSKINGQDGVILSFAKQPDRPTAEVSENVQKRLAELEEVYGGVRFTTLIDQGDYLTSVISAVLDNLLIGAALAIIILLLFLRDLRPTAVVACSIPISVTFAILLMYFSGVTLNVISMAGLAIAVGMLVDNSIVVIENIYRLRSEGASAVKAAVAGARQVAAAITSSTLTTIGVFFPLVFVQGFTRDLFLDLALTVAYALLASLAVSLTLVPTIASGVLRGGNAREASASRRLSRAAVKCVGWALGHRAALLAAAVLILAGSAFAVVSRGFEYMPEMDGREIMISVKTPGGTTLEETAAVADAYTAELSALSETTDVGAMLTSGLKTMIGLPESIINTTTSLTVYVRLADGASEAAAIEKFERLGEKYDCALEASGVSSLSSYTSALGSSGVSYYLFGNDSDDLREAAETMAAALEGVEGLAGVSNGLGSLKSELKVTVNRDAAMSMGLTTAQLWAALAGRLAENGNAAALKENGVSVDINVTSELEPALSADGLRELELKCEDISGNEVSFRLSEVAEISEALSPERIERWQQRNYLNVSAAIGSDKNVTLVSAAADRAVAEISLPAGVTLEPMGESTTIKSALSDLVWLLLFGLLTVYLIMVAQFQSLKFPFIVLFTVPLAFSGGLIALLISGSVINVFSMVGFVMLVGVIVNNGIILIDFINRLRAEGMDRRAAILEAVRVRLRPILMTTLTTVLGLLPLALGLGNGAELLGPIAVVCIGGLVYATFMTLLVIPVIYDLMGKKPVRNISNKELEEE